MRTSKLPTDQIVMTMYFLLKVCMYVVAELTLQPSVGVTYVKKAHVHKALTNMRFVQSFIGN
jgi:hypothetical protein